MESLPPVIRSFRQRLRSKKRVLQGCGVIFICILGISTTVAIVDWPFYRACWAWRAQVVHIDHFESKGWRVNIPSEFIPWLENKDLIARVRPDLAQIYRYGRGQFFLGHNSRFLAFSEVFNSSVSPCALQKEAFEMRQKKRPDPTYVFEQKTISGLEWEKYTEKINEKYYSVDYHTCDQSGRRWSAYYGQPSPFDREDFDRVEAILRDAELVGFPLE